MPLIRAPIVGALKRLALTSQIHQPSSSLTRTNTTSASRSRNDSRGEWQNSRRTARFLSTATANRASHDSSSIDYVHTPAPVTEHNGQTLPEVTRIPLLPDTETPHSDTKSPEEQQVGRVIRPEISIVSGDGTQLDMPSAMSEVTDNHAAELDPYDLTSKVHAAASKGPAQASKPQEEPGSVKAIWNGLLDDLFGERKPPQS